MYQFNTFVLMIVISMFKIAFGSSDPNCQSNLYNFSSYSNPKTLDLKTAANTVFLNLEVQNTKFVEMIEPNNFVKVSVENDELLFRTTDAFQDYERTETDNQITLLLKFICENGEIVGSFNQILFEANNHAPKFSMETYEMIVPFPLPKGFDLTPYLTEDLGIIAEDWDLVDNEISFVISENDVVAVESSRKGAKQFQAILKLKHNLFLLKEELQLEVTGTDQGKPSKSAKANVIIKPDPAIEYNCSPMFNKKLFQEDYKLSGNSITVELAPDTVHDEVQFSLHGDDKEFFEISIASDKSQATVNLISSFQSQIIDKLFLVVVVQAKCSELMKDEAIILIEIKNSMIEDESKPIETVLSVFPLEEEKEHTHVFPAKVGGRYYEIIRQYPNVSGEIFKIDKTTGWIISSSFDREDTVLFKDVEYPHFELVLRLSDSDYRSQNIDRISFQEIPYSTDTTYLKIVVEDINDNEPIFTFPSEEQVFAFPIPWMAERLLLSSLLRVIAFDLDEGLNAAIRYSISSNDQFQIDPTSGIIRPLPNALDDETLIDLEIQATDRNGSADGKVSSLKIRVKPAQLYQVSVLRIRNLDHEQIGSAIDNLEEAIGYRLQILDDDNVEHEMPDTRAKHVFRFIVIAFDLENNLITTAELASAVPSGGIFKIQSIETVLDDDDDEIDCIAYPCLMAVTVFVVLFISSAALCAFLWAKVKLLREQIATASDPDYQEPAPKVIFTQELIAGQAPMAISTPPSELLTNGAVPTTEYSLDTMPRRNRLAANLSDLLLIEENEESICSASSYHPHPDDVGYETLSVSTSSLKESK